MNKDELKTYPNVPPKEKRGGTGSAGQSGDTQGLPDTAESDSQSIEELVQEGQYLEADALLGVEESSEPDISEVRTKQVPEDDVPLEYLDRD